MKFIPTEIPDVVIIDPKVYIDNRGHFMETYQYDNFVSNGIDYHFVQDNHSHSKRGVLRGLHYQVNQVQGKLVQIASGAIFDVSVDIRKDSPTFGKWVGITMSNQNQKMIWIPPGFAHGFYVLSDYAKVLYKVTDYYSHADERCIVWDDPTLDIKWPIIETLKISLSLKDSLGKSFLEAEKL